jgi:hypothetical protein
MPIAPSPIIETVGPVAPRRRVGRTEVEVELEVVEVIGRLPSFVIEATLRPTARPRKDRDIQGSALPGRVSERHGTLGSWTVASSPISSAAGASG